MKTKIQIILVALMTVSAVHHTAAQGTVFTYQGQLIQGTNLATGGYDMTFSLYPASVGGHSLAGPVTNLGVAVANGLFTVPVDFGADVFNGGSYWLGIAVRTNGGGAFTTLAPRSAVTPTPYAIYSQMGGSATNFTGSVSGDISGTQDALVVTTVGGQTAASIALGVSAANAATPSSMPNAIVARDAHGNIAANALALEGNLNLPDPGVVYCGTNVFISEEGSLYMGKSGSSSPGINPVDLENTAFGDFALKAEATSATANGANNTALGENALTENTIGSYNTALGESAQKLNQSGSNNTAIGYHALIQNTVSDNTAVGYEALNGNTIGFYNTALGENALNENTSGSYNTAVGESSLKLNQSGHDNTALGYHALIQNTVSDNTAVGYDALPANTSGAYNSALGSQALLLNTSGSYNTALGYKALDTITSANGNTAVGYLALSAADGSDNTAVGFEAGYNLAAGNNNVFIGNGDEGLDYNSISGNNNVYIGNDGVDGDNNVIRIGPTYGTDNVWIYGTNFIQGAVSIDNPDTVFGPAILQVGPMCWCDGNSWNIGSDRNAKSGFEPVDLGAILAKVVAMPITRWHYTNNVATPHIGPMAQDFFAAFAVGTDDRHIGDVDEGGVALAAIQGLNQKVQDESQAKDGEINHLKQQNEVLAQRLQALEQMVQNLSETH